MNNEKPQTSSKTLLAQQYGVGLPVFNGWIKINPVLGEIFKPFLENNKRLLPPDVVKKVYEILGEP